MIPCFNLNNDYLYILNEFIKDLYNRRDSYEKVNESRYGFCINTSEMKEFDGLRELYPNSDDLIRFMITDRRDRGIHIDWNNGELLPKMVIFPIEGCNEKLITKWYNINRGQLLTDEYNIWLDRSKEHEVEVIHEHSITEPCLFNTCIWHGLENVTKEYRVMARWWTR